MKPRVSYSAVFGSAWDKAFAKVKELGEGKTLGDWRIAWVHEDPNWVQLTRKREKRMVRRGDSLLIELTQ